MYNITKNGICAKHLCVIDETNKTLSTKEDGLVFDFSDQYGWSFKTGVYCTFYTGDECVFNVGDGNGCTFKVGNNCSMINELTHIPLQENVTIKLKNISEYEVKLKEWLAVNNVSYGTGLQLEFEHGEFADPTILREKLSRFKGEPLYYIRNKNDVDSSHLCMIDEVNKIVATTESGLSFRFTNYGDGWTFKVGNDCTLRVGEGSTIKAGNNCKIECSHDCFIDVGNNCTILSSDKCVINMGNNCTITDGGNSSIIKSGFGCKFNKFGYNCTFNTMFNCTFETLYGCTFKVGPNCTFNVGENCSLIRHDVSGVSELPDGVTVKLNDYEVSGFLVNTKEYVKKNMNDEDGLQFILENDEWVEV